MKIRKTLDSMNSRFNWFVALRKLDSQKMTANILELEVLRNAAASWITCACGQLCKQLPRNNYTNEPLDGELRILGLQFTKQIYDESWTDAIIVLQLIEKRSSELLTSI